MVTRMQGPPGAAFKISRPAVAKLLRGFFFVCGAAQPLQGCRRRICDYGSHKAATLIDRSDALSCVSWVKGFSGLLFDGPRVSNESRTCSSRARKKRREREREQDVLTNSRLTWMEGDGQKMKMTNDENVHYRGFSNR